MTQGDGDSLMDAVWGPIQLAQTNTKAETTTVTTSHVVESHSETHITSEHHSSHAEHTEHVEFSSSAAHIQHRESIQSHESDIVRNVLGHEEQHYDVPPLHTEESHYDVPPADINKADTISTRRSSAISEVSTLKGVSVSKAHYSVTQDSNASTPIAPVKSAQLDSVIEQFKSLHAIDPASTVSSVKSSEASYSAVYSKPIEPVRYLSQTKYNFDSLSKADAHKMSQSGEGDVTVLHRAPELEFSSAHTVDDVTSRRSSQSSAGGFEKAEYVESKRDSMTVSEPYFHDLAHDVPIKVHEHEYAEPHREPSEHEEDVHFATPPPSSRASFLVESIHRDSEFEHRPLEFDQHHAPPPPPPVAAPQYNAYERRGSTETFEQASHISEESIHDGSVVELVPNVVGPKVSENLRPVVLPKDAVPPPAPVFPAYSSPKSIQTPVHHDHAHHPKPSTPLDEVEIHHHHIERRDSRSHHEAAFEEVVHRHEHTHTHEHHHVHHHESSDSDVVKSYVPLQEEMASREGVRNLRSKFENKKAPEPNYSFDAHRQVDDDYESLDGYARPAVESAHSETHHSSASSTHVVVNHGVHHSSRDHEHVLPTPPPLPRTPPPYAVLTLSRDIPHTVYRPNTEAATHKVMQESQYARPLANSEQRRGQARSGQHSHRHDEHRDESTTYVVEHVYDNVATDDYAHLRVDATAAATHQAHAAGEERRNAASSPDYAVPYANSALPHTGSQNSPCPHCPHEKETSVPPHHGFAPRNLLPDYELFFNTVHHHYTPTVSKSAEDRRSIERTHHFVPVPPRTTSRERSNSEIHIHNYIPQVSHEKPKSQIIHHHHYIENNKTVKETKEVATVHHHYIPAPLQKSAAEQRPQIETRHSFIPNPPITIGSHDREADLSRHTYIPNLLPKRDEHQKVDVSHHNYRPYIPTREEYRRDDDEWRKHSFILPVVNGADKYTEMQIERRHGYLGPIIPPPERSSRRPDELTSHNYYPALVQRERSKSESIQRTHTYVPPIYASREEPIRKSDHHYHRYTPSVPLTTERERREIEREHGYMPPIAAPRETKQRSEENIHHSYIPAVPTKEYDRIEIQRTHHYQPIAQPLNMEYQRTEKVIRTDLANHSYIPPLQTDTQQKTSNFSHEHHYMPPLASSHQSRGTIEREHHYLPPMPARIEVEHHARDSHANHHHHHYLPHVMAKDEEEHARTAVHTHSYIPPISSSERKEPEIERSHNYIPPVPTKSEIEKKELFEHHHYIPPTLQPDEQKEIEHRHNYVPPLPTIHAPEKTSIDLHKHNYTSQIYQTPEDRREIIHEHSYCPPLQTKDEERKEVRHEHNYQPYFEKKHDDKQHIDRAHNYVPPIIYSTATPKEDTTHHNYVPFVAKTAEDRREIVSDHSFIPTLCKTNDDEDEARHGDITEHNYVPPVIPRDERKPRNFDKHHYVPPIPPIKEGNQQSNNTTHSYQPIVPKTDDSRKYTDTDYNQHSFIPPTNPKTDKKLENVDKHHYVPPVLPVNESEKVDTSHHSYLPTFEKSEETRRDIVREHNFVPTVLKSEKPKNHDVAQHNFIPPTLPSVKDERKTDTSSHHYQPLIPESIITKHNKEIVREHGFVPVVSKTNEPEHIDITHHKYQPPIFQKPEKSAFVQEKHNYVPVIPPIESRHKENVEHHSFKPTAPKASEDRREIERMHAYVPIVHRHNSPVHKHDLTQHNYQPVAIEKFERSEDEIVHTHNYLPIVPKIEQTSIQDMHEHHFVPSIPQKREIPSSQPDLNRHNFLPTLPEKEFKSGDVVERSHHYLPISSKPDREKKEIEHSHGYLPVGTRAESEKREIDHTHSYLPVSTNRENERKEVDHSHSYLPVSSARDSDRKEVNHSHSYLPITSTRESEKKEIDHTHSYLPISSSTEPERRDIDRSHGYVPASNVREQDKREIEHENSYVPYYEKRRANEKPSDETHKHGYIQPLSKQNYDRRIIHENQYTGPILLKEESARKGPISDHSYLPLAPNKQLEKREIIRDNQYYPLPIRADRQTNGVNPSHAYIQKIDDTTYKRELIRDHSYVPFTSGSGSKLNADALRHFQEPLMIRTANETDEQPFSGYTDNGASPLSSAEMELYRNYSGANYRHSPSSNRQTAPMKWGRSPKANYPEDSTIFASESMTHLHKAAANATPPPEPRILVQPEPHDAFPNEPATFRPQAAPRSQKTQQDSNYGGVIRERRRSSNRAPIAARVFARQSSPSSKIDEASPKPAAIPVYANPITTVTHPPAIDHNYSSSRVDMTSPKPAPLPVFASSVVSPYHRPSYSRVETASPKLAPLPVFAYPTSSPHHRRPHEQRHSSPTRIEALSPKPAPMPIYANPLIAKPNGISKQHAVSSDNVNDEMQKKQSEHHGHGHTEHTHHAAGHDHYDHVDVQYQRQVKQHDVNGAVRVEKQEKAYEHIQIHPKGKRADAASPVEHHKHIQEPAPIPTKGPIRDRAPSRTKVHDRHDSAPILYASPTEVHQHSDTNGYTGIHAHSHHHLPPDDDHIAPVYTLTDRFGGAVKSHKIEHHQPASPVYEQIQQVEQQHQIRTSASNSINRPPSTTPIHVKTHHHHNDYETHNSVRIVRNVREFVHKWGDKDFVPPPHSPLASAPRLNNSPHEVKHTHSHPQPAARSHTPTYAYAGTTQTQTNVHAHTPAHEHHHHHQHHQHHENPSKRNSISSGHHHVEPRAEPRHDSVSYAAYEAPRRDTVTSQTRGHQIYDNHHTNVSHRDHGDSVSQRIEHHDEDFELEPVSKRREVFEYRSTGIVRTYSGHKKVHGDIKPLVDLRS